MRMFWWYVKMRELPLSLFRYFVLLSAIYTSPFGCDIRHSSHSLIVHLLSLQNSSAFNF